MKKYTHHPITLIVLMAVLFTAYVGCDKEDSSEKNPPYAVPTCGDGIMNQGEFHIDCGGPCTECVLQPAMTAFIDSFWVDTSMRGNGLWEADTVASNEVVGGFYIGGVDTISFKSISFTHTQGLQRGVYVYEDIDGTTFGCELLDGIVEIIAVDSVNHVVSGNYSFNCVGHISEKKERVLNGKFRDIKYKK